MHSVLLIVETSLARRQPNEEQIWQSFLREARNIADKNKQIEHPSENSWLIPLQNGLPSFVEIAHAAGKVALPYRAHFFADAPVWILSSPLS